MVRVLGQRTTMVGIGIFSSGLRRSNRRSALWGMKVKQNTWATKDTPLVSANEEIRLRYKSLRLRASCFYISLSDVFDVPDGEYVVGWERGGACRRDGGGGPFVVFG